MSTVRRNAEAGAAGMVAGLPPTLEWVGAADGVVRLIDQTKLPERLETRDCATAEAIWEAIRTLRVRGAPAIGVAGAYGLCLGTRAARDASRAAFLSRVREVGRYLSECRPTAVNLGWAIQRVTQVAEQSAQERTSDIWAAMLSEAHALAREDAEVCWRIGENGAHLVSAGAGVLTHCNAGALATVAHGTALSILYAAWRRGRRFQVYADETRPLLQGARLTAWELQAAGLDVSVVCDGAAASLMQAGRIQLVVVGADRIAANGDVANKIGTYGAAVAARHHGIPFYVAAPLSTFDLSLASGKDIPIEQRPEDEVRVVGGRVVVPAGVRCLNPAFDVTPASLVTAIVTEQGLAQPVTEENIRRFFQLPG
ncbi:MAG: S-methyl-5-thioribose-1-phosphate isomerase [Planctomycetota bacterium]